MIDEKGNVGKMNLPRLMIAAPGSGSGKTMLTCGLLKLLQQRCRPVAFKCGPDYIDPMFHRAVLGIPSRNLDTFFTEADTTNYLMGRSAKTVGADFAVIEGVMGYYDGLGGISTKASSYELSVQTETPVVLVVGGKGMSLSILAVIRGFLDLYPDQKIVGVILNRVSEAIFERLKPMIESELHIAAVGYVPETKGMAFPSRHLGLMMPEEIRDLQKQIADFADILEKTIDISELCAIAQQAPVLTLSFEDQEDHSDKDNETVRLAVARDEAFCFYYEDNLEMLRALGAEIVYFSPMRDACLPENISGLYMGGGYPELHARLLSENKTMHQSIREAVAAGMPCLAECGAYMYLHERMEDADGRLWPMASVIEGSALNKGRLVRFGYAMLTAQEETILGPVGTRLPAHEFHYWDTTDQGGCFLAEKPLTARTWQCMYKKNHLLAGFPHLYFYGNPSAAENYIAACRHFLHERGKKDVG